MSNFMKLVIALALTGPALGRERLALCPLAFVRHAGRNRQYKPNSKRMSLVAPLAGCRVSHQRTLLSGN